MPSEAVLVVSVILPAGATMLPSTVIGPPAVSETDACGNALQVKDGDKTVTYYIKDKGKGEKYHKCAGEQAAKVTGKVTEKDGKHYIENAKVVKQ